MATPAAPAPTKPGAKKKIPTWYWVVGAGVVAGGYLLWKRSQAASTAAAAAATSTPVASGDASTAGTAAQSYGSTSGTGGVGSYPVWSGGYPSQPGGTYPNPGATATPLPGTVVTSTSTPPATTPLPVAAGAGQDASGSGVLPIGSIGQQTAAAAPYALENDIINGQPYTKFAFPQGTSPQTIAQDLYGSAPSGLQTLMFYDPSGGPDFELASYPGEPAVPDAA